VELGRTGEQVSQLSLGCMLTGTRTDEPTSVQMLSQYLDRGGSFLDTATCYCWRHDRGSYRGPAAAARC
jgi:aryl-alcohol dehydrogenase-like predicted oxidoreductase